MCNACYEYVRKHGTVVRPPRPQPLPPERRIWKFVDKDGPVSEPRPDLGKCWIWTGGKGDKGYGHFGWSPNVKIQAHRAVWMLLVGDIPEGLQLDHLCRVTSCVNPEHLEPVTNAKNMARAVAAWTTCRNGHDLADEGHVWRGGKRLCARCDRERFERFYAKHGGYTAYMRGKRAA